MKPRPLPTTAELQQLFAYDPETGKFRDPVTGVEAFTSQSRGYLRTNRGGRFFFAHRVAWKLVHDSDPEHIDHINGDKSDNRIVNLRSVDQQTNNRNMRVSRSNKSGHPGVYFSANRWRARIKVNRRYIALGAFLDRGAAVSARKAAEQQYGFHPNHGRI